MENGRFGVKYVLKSRDHFSKWTTRVRPDIEIFQALQLHQ